MLDKGLDASKRSVHKAGEFIGNKIADAIQTMSNNVKRSQTKSNDDKIVKQKPVEEIINPPESVRVTNAANGINKKLVFKNNALFRSCISKNNNSFIENAEDFDIAMSIYNLLEYIDNNSMTSGSL